MTDPGNAPRPIDLVTASAGTGKTTALVSEIHKAIDDGVAASSILATTFTNKAADELVERTRSHLIGKGMVEQAADLLAARIGTVNATFGKIVTEFALNAGRSPVANIVSEQHQQRIFAIAAEGAIRKRAGSMIPVAQRLGIVDWSDDVRKLADLVRQNDIDPDTLKDHAERSWQGMRAIFPEQSEKSAKAIDRALRTALEKTREGLDANGDETRKTAGVRREIDEALARLESDHDLSWADWAKLTKLKPGILSADIVERVTKTASGHAAHPRLHADLEDYIRGVYETAAEALKSYALYKAENGLIDFVDQENEALRLLGHAEVAAQLRETLARAFVDEFQDTSPIQLALFLKVAQIAGRSFWVGDPKQAIYGFRGSDPDLTIRVANEIVDASGGAGRTLATSYRSRPGLVDFANRSFGPAFEALGFAPEHARIEDCSRGDLDNQPIPVEVWGLSGKNWDLRILALAQRIRTVLGTPDAYMVEDKPAGTARPLRGRDIAILCRSNDRCDKVAKALAQEGVRVSITRAGLLETPEAALAVAALRYLVDPRDTLAIAEIAHFMSDDREQPSWFEASLSEDGIRSLPSGLPALAAIDGRREDLAHLTPREALEIAISTAGLLDRIASWSDPLERIGNVDALRGLAAQYEDEATALRSAATAGGLVAWLENSADELPASPRPDAVNVLTYHRAKGLEWPMVVLLDLQSDRKGDAFGLRVEADGKFDVWRPLDGRWARFWPWPYGQQRKNVHIDTSVLETQESRVAIARGDAEAVRLLYVGVTRARDYLVLAPQHSERGGSNTAWFDQLVGKDGVPVLDFSSAEEGVLAAGGSEIRVRFEPLAEDEKPAKADADSEALYRRPASSPEREYPPYRVAPSAAGEESVTGVSVVSRIALGQRIPISGPPEPTVLGNAVHAFLAFDLLHPDPDGRRDRARETLERWQVAAVTDDQLVEMSDRLRSHLGSACPGMTVRTEVPVFGRRGGQRLRGFVDVLLAGGGRAVVIDHKTYSGAYETWEERAIGYGPQLAAYALAVGEATGCAEVETWVHMPVVGQLIQLRVDA